MNLNLASGLLSGTTSKAGVGGALEVFGKALGPAVNNYATIKLKENELENELMGDALELASDEMQARNDLLEAQASGGELEFNKFGIIKNKKLYTKEDINKIAFLEKKTENKLSQKSFVESFLQSVRQKMYKNR